MFFYGKTDNAIVGFHLINIVLQNSPKTKSAVDYLK